MSELVLVEFKVKPESVSGMKSYLAEILPDTRVYEGCQEIEAYFNMEDAGTIILVERWTSRAHYEKYFAWRKETGVLDKIGSMLAGPPSIQYFQRIET